MYTNKKTNLPVLLMIISVPTSKNLYQSFASISDKVIDPFICGMQLFSSSGKSEDHCISEYPEELELEFAYIWQTSVSDDWTSSSGEDDPLDGDIEDVALDETLFCIFSLFGLNNLDCFPFSTLLGWKNIFASTVRLFYSIRI